MSLGKEFDIIVRTLTTEKTSRSTADGKFYFEVVASANKDDVKEAIQKIFDVVGCSGVVRIDFMIDTKTGKVFANEINTIPGSFAFYLWNNKGINFVELSDRLIQIAVDNNNNKNKLVSNFISGVLGGKAGIK